MSGIVQGGWPFVWGAYIVSVLVLSGYAVYAIREAVRRITGQA